MKLHACSQPCSHSRRARHGSLWIIPALAARQQGDHAVFLTANFLEGVRAYQQLWPGEVVVAMSRDALDIGSLDEVLVQLNELPFRFHWLPEQPGELLQLLEGAGVVLASLVEPPLPLSNICAQLGVPLVLNAEYTLRTRRQIVCTETRNPIIRARRLMWVTRQESRFRRAVASAQGVQCNGTPTFDAYRNISPNPLLYFDSRINPTEVISTAQLEARLDSLAQSRPLRLAFTGRLMPMKGADHLPRFVDALLATGTPFTLDICGDGPTRAALERHVEHHQLADSVRLRGVLDFHSQLLPFLAQHVDLFICPHKQGDPSCTYLETLACGVPLLGYDNEALAGLLRLAHVGWHTPLNNPTALAREVAAINADRPRLAAAARQARAFAQQHTFDQTTRCRIDHLLACSESLAREAAC